MTRSGWGLNFGNVGVRKVAAVRGGGRVANKRKTTYTPSERILIGLGVVRDADIVA